MKLTNREMDEYLYALNEISTKTKGKLAYAIAKNMRVMQNELIEYYKIKDEALRKYGTSGNDGTYQIRIDSEEFKSYVTEMKPYDDIESEVHLTMVSPEDIYELGLNGQETMKLLFMIEDKE